MPEQKKRTEPLYLEDAYDRIRDSDSVYLYSENLSLDSTKELTKEDVAEHRHVSFAGCYEISRDPLTQRALIDPEGDEEFDTEMKYGSPVPMEICRSKHHKGRALIPKVEFEEGATKCRRCLRMEEFLARGRSTPEVSPKKRKWFRQFHGDKRASVR